MSNHAAPGICRFIFSADLHVLVRCRIDRLLPQAQAEELIGDEPLDIEVDLVLDGEVFRTVQSSQAVFDASPEKGFFRPQHFLFAVKVRDLPRQCSLVVRLRSRSWSACCYRGVLPLFNRRAVLRQGRQLLALARLEEGGSPDFDWTEHSNDAQLRAGPPSLEEALRLAQAAEQHARGWLPAAAPGFEGSEEAFARSAQEALEATGVPWLSVHLPTFMHPVVFAEPQYDQEIEVPTGMVSAPRREDAEPKSLAALGGAGWLLQPLVSADEQGGASLRTFKCFADHDASNEHPAVLKDMRLARSSRNRVKDRDARPNADELRRLNELIRRPRRQFSAEEKHLLFRFRWSLTDQPGALTKFLHAVDWSDLEERQHAIELLGHWSPVDIDDALELLSKDFRGVREVRRHAVARLRSASDEDLQLYLLQLVQALRYEPILEEAAGAGDAAAAGQEEETPLSVASPHPAEFSPPARKGFSGGPAVGSPVGTGDAVGPGRGAEGQQRCALMWFLIRRAVRCRTLATLFYWYVVAETDDRERGVLFHRVRERFLEALGESAEGQATRQMLDRQVALRRKLLWSLQCAKVMKRDRIEKKVERFRQALALEPPPPEDGRPPCRLSLVEGLDEAVPLPVDPSVALARVVPDQSFLLKSAMNPGVLTCQVQRTSEGSRGKKISKKIMVKEGDDLRQDQLVLQLIILMDSILKKYGLDMQLTTYQVIAMSTNDGMVEFVPDAANLSSVLKDHNNDIQQFFRAHHPLPAEGGHSSEPPGPGNSYGIRPEVLENFIRSSAGYCVITYILGIGDRHLDNLMVTPDGRLFHIDFGFILGKDPKPFPPPMRICKEMVEGMGGNSSPGYQSFKSKCCQAYKILRRHAKLIINLLYLMTDSGIKDLCADPQFAILKVEQKFQALMDDEQAEEHFLKLIDESVNSLFPVVMEKLHKMSIAMQ